ncbi:MAG TPA: helix-turn-helix transcriptional regulator [Actinophytocola sp.]|uniref:helix-turn-helix domain-containing protein n=1 Tax=Actinophytocola sp. TaxID=1872138 RepID=UPI002E093819|nr:helix-turn-helix transcriptional regulator [Actinophytocola sp.]
MANELRRLRKRAGLTTGEVGARLGLSQSKVSRVETGGSGLQINDVAAMLGLYHVPAKRRDEILALVSQAAEPGLVQLHGRKLPEQWQALIEWEDKAVTLQNWAPLGIPGLLQTADYARAIIRGMSERELPESEVDTMVKVRLGRRAILSRPLPPKLHILLYEPALHVAVGGPDVLAVQLRHLAEATRRASVTIQVVPFSAGPHPGLEGPFMLMGFPSDPPLVYLENRVMSIFLEEESHTASYRLAWQRILAKALSPERSAKLIADRAEGSAK